MSIVVCAAMFLFLQTMVVNFIFSRGEYTAETARRYERALLISLYVGMIGYAVLSALSIFLCSSFPFEQHDDGSAIAIAIVLIINVPIWIGGWMYEITGHKVLIILYHIFFALLVLTTAIGIFIAPNSDSASAPPYSMSASQKAVSTTTASTEVYYVYTTRAGKKYHQINCRYVKIKSATKRTVSNAEQEGFFPCSVCKP